MALTRKFLSAMNVEGDVADQIIQEHSATTTRMKTELDELKTKAAKVDELQKNLNDLQNAGKANSDYKQKFESVSKEFEDFKTQIESQKAESEKRGLYRDLLKEAGVDAKRLDSVLKVSDLSGVSVKDGTISDKEKLLEGIKSNWSDFIVQTTTQGASVATPPKGAGGASVTKEEFAKMNLRQRNELYENDRATYDALTSE